MFLPLYEGFDPLYHVVLTHQEFLQFLALVPAHFLHPIDLALNGRALSLPPEPFDAPGAVVGVVHVRFAFTRDGRHELGIHRG
jgi:hypothetical protein